MYHTRLFQGEQAKGVDGWLNSFKEDGYYSTIVGYAVSPSGCLFISVRVWKPDERGPVVSSDIASEFHEPTIQTLEEKL